MILAVIVALAAAAAGYALGKASAQADRIVREEVDEQRHLDDERRELTDPDEFAMNLRVHPDIDTRLPGDDR